uniref:Putative secreted protein n=1 Tax=Ixodes ricinus TaxID=34613 RepID=A0A6B0UKM0_IXORI
MAAGRVLGLFPVGQTAQACQFESMIVCSPAHGTIFFLDQTTITFYECYLLFSAGTFLDKSLALRSVTRLEPFLLNHFQIAGATFGVSRTFAVACVCCVHLRCSSVRVHFWINL